MLMPCYSFSNRSTVFGFSSIRSIDVRRLVSFTVKVGKNSLQGALNQGIALQPYPMDVRHYVDEKVR